jgi:DNA-binding transcriptional LysR family regulator
MVGYMDISSITYFLAAAESKSFSAAARNMYVSQPSISKSIAKLEDELGLTLFNRSGKTVHLTAAGKQLYYDFRTMLQFFEEIIQHAKDINNAVTGTVSICVPQHMDLGKSIPGFLKKFSIDNPGIRIIMNYEPRNSRFRNFIDNSTDCTFFLSLDAEYLQDEMHIQKIDLPRTPHRLIYSPSIFTSDSNVTPESFIDKKLFSYRGDKDRYSISRIEDEVLESIGLNSKAKTWVDSVDALLYFVSEGLGVSLIGPSIRLEWSERIHWIPVLTEKSMVHMSLCWKETNNNSAFHTFADALKVWCSNIPANQ